MYSNFSRGIELNPVRRSCFYEENIYFAVLMFCFIVCFMYIYNFKYDNSFAIYLFFDWYSLLNSLLNFFYLIFSLIFTAPVQFVLNVKPKRFNILYLLIYATVAFIATAFAMILLGEKPFSMLSHYIFSTLAAILFWFFDSILLQKE